MLNCIAMGESHQTWTEADSRTFLDLADVAVPGRKEQMELLLSLIPAQPSEAFLAADLCCGEGLLASRLLERYPQARLIALDGSPLMREQASKRLAAFRGRSTVRAFQLADLDWLASFTEPLRCVISSLAFHHLTPGDKRRLFQEVRDRLEPGGALLIADIVAPASENVRLAFRDLIDSIARQQSLTLTGSLEAFETLRKEGWNSFAEPEQPPGEIPSPLFEQLKWLEEAGFSAVDCFWMRAGIAVYGGYR